MLERDDTLENRIKEARRNLEQLQNAKRRKDKGLPCSTSDSHVTQCLCVVAFGGAIERVKERIGFELKVSGYQLHRCLACGNYILKNLMAVMWASWVERTASGFEAG